MQETHCPFCQTLLETIDVAPCWDCGWQKDELRQSLNGEHTFSEFKIFGELSAVLCNFCDVDFGSYDPKFFGLQSKATIGFEKMQFVRSVDAVIRKDKFCPECKTRLAFIRFVQKARTLNQKV